MPLQIRLHCRRPALYGDDSSMSFSIWLLFVMLSSCGFLGFRSLLVAGFRGRECQRAGVLVEDVWMGQDRFA